jgi:hypothetical protein
MANEDYNFEESKETLLVFMKDMVEAWEDFLINKEAVSSLLEEIKANETDEAYKSKLSGIGISIEDADEMIAAYQEELSNGKNEKRHSA